VFDSSVARGQPFQFELGRRQVILGWDGKLGLLLHIETQHVHMIRMCCIALHCPAAVGVASMQRGEKCVLRCAPEYAYGKSGAGKDIPPNATLYFEIELIDWTTGSTMTQYWVQIVAVLMMVAIVVYVLYF
jgi:hypothetical protein